MNFDNEWFFFGEIGATIEYCQSAEHHWQSQRQSWESKSNQQRCESGKSDQTAGSPIRKITGQCQGIYI